MQDENIHDRHSQHLGETPRCTCLCMCIVTTQCGFSFTQNHRNKHTNGFILNHNSRISIFCLPNGENGNFSFFLEKVTIGREMNQDKSQLEASIARGTAKQRCYFCSLSLRCALSLSFCDKTHTREEATLAKFRNGILEIFVLRRCIAAYFISLYLELVVFYYAREENNNSVPCTSIVVGFVLH